MFRRLIVLVVLVHALALVLRALEDWSIHGGSATTTWPTSHIGYGFKTRA